MAHNSLCLAKEIPFNEIVPGRILHVRILGKNVALDVMSCYQCVWCSKETLAANEESRSSILNALGKSLK